jgi:DNA-binding transcriptional MocR family regulator
MHSTTLYEDLAERLKSHIQRGVYSPGEKVPSVRRLSGQHRVSPATVVAAYRLLETQGWLEARPQSGFFVLHTDSQPPLTRQTCCEERPCSVSVNELAMRVMHASQRADLVSLGAAVPHTALLPLKALKESLTRTLRRDPDQGTRYSFPPGEEVLRVQIARRADAAGCALGPDDIHITSGCQEALNLALRAVTQTGDIVAIESPAFFGTLQAIESLGLKALEIPTDADGLSLEALQLALERWPVKAVLAVTNFSNPSGALMPDERKHALVKLLADHDIPLIEDDIYGDLAFARERPHAAKAYDRHGNVLLCSSFSKTVAPGYRIGWIAPGRWAREVAHLKYVSSMATASLPQLAMADYLASGRYDRHLQRLRRVAEENLSRLRTSVARAFPVGTRISRPSGGFILWVELPANHDSMALFEHAQASGIGFTPGPLFSPQGKFGNCLRLAGGMPWEPRIEAAVQELGRLAAALR